MAWAYGQGMAPGMMPGMPGMMPGMPMPGMPQPGMAQYAVQPRMPQYAVAQPRMAMPQYMASKRAKKPASASCPCRPPTVTDSQGKRRTIEPCLALLDLEPGALVEIVQFVGSLRALAVAARGTSQPLAQWQAAQRCAALDEGALEFWTEHALDTERVAEFVRAQPRLADALRAQLECVCASEVFDGVRLSRVCRGIVQMANVLPIDDEKLFLVAVIKLLLATCENRSSRLDKSFVAHHLLEIIFPYTKFMMQHQDFFCTAFVNKVVEFLHQGFIYGAPVQPAQHAADIFLRVCKNQQFVRVIAREDNPRKSGARILHALRENLSPDTATTLRTVGGDEAVHYLQAALARLVAAAPAREHEELHEWAEGLLYGVAGLP